MKPHPRIRKTIKWGGAVVTVLLVVVWIGSIWWAAVWLSRDGSGIVLSGGRLTICVDTWVGTRNSRAICMWKPNEMGVSWGFDAGEWVAGWTVVLPNWFPVIVCGTLTVLAWRLDTLARRRARLNLCPKCSYDRTGLVEGKNAVCPECGSLPPAPPSNPAPASSV